MIGPLLQTTSPRVPEHNRRDHVEVHEVQRMKDEIGEAAHTALTEVRLGKDGFGRVPRPAENPTQPHAGQRERE